MKIGRQVFLVTFEAFECASVEESDEDGLRDADFYLDMRTEQWEELPCNIRTNGRADSDYTLNSLDLASPDGIVKPHDECQRLAFFRFNSSLQTFLDAAAQVETTYV